MCLQVPLYVGCKGLYVVVGSITVVLRWAGLAPDQPSSDSLLQVEAASLWVQSGLDYMVQSPKAGPSPLVCGAGLGYLAANSGGPVGAAPLEVGTVTQGGWLHTQEVPGVGVGTLVNRPKSRATGYKS